MNGRRALASAAVTSRFGGSHWKMNGVWFLDQTWPKSYLWNEQAERKCVSLPSHMLRKREVVCVVWFVPCRSTCVTLWEDELRQREKRNAAVTLVFGIAQEMWHVCFTHTRLWSCETTAQWPPAVSVQKAVISGTKQSTVSICMWLKDPPPSSRILYAPINHFYMACMKTE